MIQALIFVFVSVIITKYSSASLRNPRSHGFFRFFAFEAILLIVCYNLSVWFKDPFTTFHIISWLLLILSIPVAFYSFWQMARIGRPAGNFENTTILVQTGVFRFIRHPLYLSLLLLSAGATFKQVDFFTIILFFASFIAIYLTAKNEEAENLAKFGVNYEQYIHKTKMFIPFIF